MEKGKSVFTELLTIAALAGNLLFILWITYNGLHEHFSGTVYEKLSYIGLTGLLIINSLLILRKNKRANN